MLKQDTGFSCSFFPIGLPEVLSTWNLVLSNARQLDLEIQVVLFGKTSLLALSWFVPPKLWPD